LLEVYGTNERETEGIESWLRSLKFILVNGKATKHESRYVFPNTALLKDTGNNST
jgi:hypothetical protein